jgi:hypothetical protein
MFVEPKVFQELVDSGRVVPVPESQQLSGSSAAAGAGAGAGASGSSSLALPSSSSGSLCGMLVSTAQHALSAAPGALLPSISWPGPSLSSSGGGAGGSSNAPADKAAAGGMPPASPPCAAAAGGASAATANIKTWQPELHITQQQQEAAAEGGDCGCQVSVSDLIPDAVAQQLDLVVVLGGDGTVLWTCHIFGNRRVVDALDCGTAVEACCVSLHAATRSLRLSCALPHNLPHTLQTLPSICTCTHHTGLCRRWCRSTWAAWAF